MSIHHVDLITSKVITTCAYPSCVTILFFSRNFWFLLLVVDNKMKMARKPGKKQKENPVRCSGEDKRWKGNIREASGKGKPGTVMELSLEVRWPLWGLKLMYTHHSILLFFDDNKTKKARKPGIACQSIMLIWSQLGKDTDTYDNRSFFFSQTMIEISHTYAVYLDHVNPSSWFDHK